MKDYYQILGVSRSASHHQIRSAYRRLVVRYHPDRNPDPAAHEIIREVNEAYDTLGDVAKKEQYDYHLTVGYNDTFVWEMPQQPEDPRYRRHRPANYPPPKPKTTVYDLMARYIPYLYWFNWAGLVVVTLLAVDYLLPIHAVNEKVSATYAAGESGTVGWYNVIVTETGREVKLHDNALKLFKGDSIRIVYTPLLSEVISVANLSNYNTARLGGIYSPMIVVPITLSVMVLLGLLNRKNIEYAFNFSIASGVLTFISILLILLT